MHKLWRVMLATTVTLMFSVIPFALPLPVAAQVGPPTKVYNFFATDGWWTMADGTQIYSYGFVGGLACQPFSYMTKTGGLVNVPGGAPAPVPGPNTPAEQALQGNAQFPAPMIYCTTNDIVQINLKNIGVNNRQAPNDPHSIHLHGMDVDVANDGVPETSVGAVPSNYGIALSGIPGAGNVIVYMFHPSGPGTYFYHCHQEASIHVDMGMYGALVVYNPTDPAAATGPGTGNGGVLFGNAYDADVVLMLSDTDIRQHKSEQLGGVPVSFNPVNYTPQYWFINGLSFPNTIHAGFLTGFSWTNWITAHPGYDPLIAYSRTAKPKVLIRMINMGFQTHPMHMHGYHGQLIGSDQRAFPWSSLGYEQKQTVNIGSGETYEWLINLADQQTTSTYNAGTYSKYNPANGSPQLNTSAFPPIPEPATGNPYVGGPVVTGSTLGPAPSQIFVFHNHEDYKATNNGVYPGGMFTIIMPLP